MLDGIPEDRALLLSPRYDSVEPRAVCLVDMDNSRARSPIVATTDDTAGSTPMVLVGDNIRCEWGLTKAVHLCCWSVIAALGLVSLVLPRPPCVRCAVALPHCVLVVPHCHPSLAQSQRVEGGPC